MHDEDAGDDGHEPECPCSRCEARRKRLGVTLGLITAGLAAAASLAELLRSLFNLHS